MNTDTQTQLLALFQRYQQLWQSTCQSLPTQEFDPEWPSPCQVGDVTNDLVHWEMLARDKIANFKNIEEALEVALHPSISELFCHVYSGYITAEFEGHPISLIQVWNEQDFSHLQENMIAHFMMQKRLKQSASMFIATCSDEMQVISILNETGQVQLETLGKKQEIVLAQSVAEFLQKLTPVIYKD